MNRQHSKLGNQHPISSQSYMVITQYGDMLVVKQGVQSQLHHHHHHQSTPLSGSPSGLSGQLADQQQQQQHQTRPIIMTFHDLGLNSELQFATFCECDEVKLMLQTFTMIHVNFIGQESQHHHTDQRTTTSLPDDFKYPSVEQMAESIVDICAQLRVRSFIAIAVGAGAHIVGSLALMRPDLVDGLFLINPVITSCSITEWLYFKMSAIASNHRIGAWGSADSHPNEPPTENSDSPQRSQSKHSPASGLRKLLNAAHIHLPHHHHHNNSGQVDGGKKETTDSRESADESAHLEPEELAQNSDTGEHRHQLNSVHEHEAMSVPATSGGRQASGSRLRQLIFSRNFRLKGGQHSQSMSVASEGDTRSMRRATTLKSRDSKEVDTSHDDSSDGTPPGSSAGRGDHKHPHKHKRLQERKATHSGGSGDSIDSQHHQRASSGKRPPLEYLMYHHFGSASFQRYRRSSDTPMLHYDLSQRSSNDATATSSLDSSDQQITTCADPDGKTASGGSGRRNRLVHTCSRSHDGLQEHSPSSLASSARANRSGSIVCLEAACLAAFSNDRQRHAYMQNVYKHHFNQLDAHNLWLFAQSFAKRRNLNLRKDCGAAAHAAAAAATLGTSICTAFVGMAPSPSVSGANAPATAAAASSWSTASLEKAASGSGASKPVVDQVTSEKSESGGPNSASKSGAANQKQQQQHRQQAHRQQPVAPQVAGTKVKRTFTCQTLIMCSSVQMHCERAFKLMSLLNPLQATWIKTDHLLVLEERPDKVCQALRLFLQGIGYSMSTYERRLRLSSATGSASSADSTGSARSLNEKG